MAATGAHAPDQAAARGLGLARAVTPQNKGYLYCVLPGGPLQPNKISQSVVSRIARRTFSFSHKS